MVIKGKIKLHMILENVKFDIEVEIILVKIFVWDIYTGLGRLSSIKSFSKYTVCIFRNID